MNQSAASFNHAVTAQNYIDLYEKMLERPLIRS
jgi:starch synthase